eukprot:31009-Pelagococcus_subviridis.AAC.1
MLAAARGSTRTTTSTRSRGREIRRRSRRPAPLGERPRSPWFVRSRGRCVAADARRGSDASWAREIDVTAESPAVSDAKRTRTRPCQQRDNRYAVASQRARHAQPPHVRRRRPRGAPARVAPPLRGRASKTLARDVANRPPLPHVRRRARPPLGREGPSRASGESDAARRRRREDVPDPAAAAQADADGGVEGGAGGGHRAEPRVGAHGGAAEGAERGNRGARESLAR